MASGQLHVKQRLPRQSSDLLARRIRRRSFDDIITDDGPFRRGALDDPIAPFHSFTRLNTMEVEYRVGSHNKPAPFKQQQHQRQHCQRHCCC